MFRFKLIPQKHLNRIDYVSIHPMFRFKEKQEHDGYKHPKFQYILCFGSSLFIQMFLGK